MALATNLISYWKLDESSGDAQDSYGSNTLTNVSTVTYAAGIINNGASFSSNRLEIASTNTDFQFERTDAFSMQMWAKTNTSEDAYIMGRIDSEVDGIGYAFNKVNNSATSPIAVYLYATTGNQIIKRVSSADFVDNAWHHIVMTYDGSSTLAGLKLYVDNVEMTDSTGSTVSTLTNSILGANNEFCLGARELGNQPFTGMLDECAVWSRALSSTEITTLYNSGSGLQYPFIMPTNIKSVNGLAVASVKSKNGLAMGSIKSINGLA